MSEKDPWTMRVAHNCSAMLFYQVANFEAILSYFEDIGEEIQNGPLRKEFHNRCTEIDRKSQDMMETMRLLVGWIEETMETMPIDGVGNETDVKTINGVTNVVKFNKDKK